MIETDEGYRLDLQRVERSRWFYIDTPQGRSDWYELSVQQVPLIEELWVAYRYPAHTARPPRRYRLTSDKIEALTGTEVSLEAVSNYPLAAARVELFAGDPSHSRPQPQQKLLLRPAAQSAPRVRGAFRLTQSGRLTLRLVGANQQLGPELREIPLVALDDQPPQVALVDPEPLALAVEGWKVPLEVDATDDFQVTDLQVHYRFDGQPSQSVKLTTGGSDRRQRHGQAELDLAQLAAKAGDRIQVSATATDNHPSGGQVGASPLHRIEVISHDQYLDHMRSVYQLQEMLDEIAAVNERLDELAQQRQHLLDEIDALHRSLANGQQFDVQQHQPSEQLRQELEQYAAQMHEFAGRLDERLAAPQVYDAEQAYRQQLEALAEQLERQRRDVDDLEEALEALSRDGKPGAEELERLQQAREHLRRSTEPLTQPETTGLAESQRQVEKLVQAHRMLQELERIERVVQQQRELAQRFQTLEPAPRPSTDQQRRTDQLARQQERLNQELDEAQRALRKVAEDAKKTLPRTSTDACRLCDSIGQAGISGDQQEAARAARQGAVPQAQQSARQAADKLESLAAQGPRPGASDIGREWSPDDLDRGLRLSPQGVERTLQQLARSQSLRPFASGQLDARAESHGRLAGSSRVGLHGPRPPDPMFAARRGQRTQPSSRGGGEPSADGPVGEAETIDATARSADLDAAGNVRGVPVGYRDQAEAYFRRLAEEAAGEPTESDK
jgi:hypothetical protein